MDKSYINVTFPNENSSVSVSIEDFEFEVRDEKYIFEDVVFGWYDNILVRINRSDYNKLIKK